MRNNRRKESPLNQILVVRKRKLAPNPILVLRNNKLKALSYGGLLGSAQTQESRPQACLALGQCQQIETFLPVQMR